MIGYRRSAQRRPVLGPFIERLEKTLAEDQKLAKRHRHSGFEGPCTSVAAEPNQPSFESSRPRGLAALRDKARSVAIA
jgi:hypothetical protein